MTRARQASVFLLLAATAALLASGFLYGSTSDEEEYRSALLSAQLFARALVHGNYLMWTSQLGMGLPQPLGPSFLFHPLLPLLGFMPADLWVALLLTVHLAFGTVGGWRLARVLGLSPIGSAMCGVTLLLATPTQNALLTDFWPTLFVSWTTIPWLILGFLKLLDRPPGSRMLSHAAGTGMLGGLIIANGHTGYLIVYAPALLAFLSWHWRTIVRDRREWFLLLVVGVVVATPTLAYLAGEFLTFPSGLPRDNSGGTLALRDLAGVLLRPFAGSFTDPLDATRALGTRSLFFGGPFTILAVIGGARAISGRVRGDLALGAVAALVLLLLPGLNRIQFFTATYLFRDPLVLFAAPLAALVLDSLLERSATKPFAVSLVGAQVGVLVLSAWPFLQDTWATRNWDFAPGRAITRATPLTESIQDAVASAPGRLYLSNGVDGLVTSNALRRDGLVSNSLAYLGVAVVNGRFKGVSADGISPSTTVPYGMIGGEPSVQETTALLNLAGFRYVLALEGEAVAPGLERSLSVRDSRQRVFILWHNPTAIHGATVMAEQARNLTPEHRVDCPTSGLLCMKVDDLISLIRPGVRDVQNRDGHISIQLEPSDQPRLLLVTEMFRPEWTTETSGADVHPALNGLMFVDVPSGTNDVTLVYRPSARIMLNAIAWVAILTTIVAYLRTTKRSYKATRASS